MLRGNRGVRTPSFWIRPHLRPSQQPGCVRIRDLSPRTGVPNRPSRAFDVDAPSVLSERVVLRCSCEPELSMVVSVVGSRLPNELQIPVIRCRVGLYAAAAHYLARGFPFSLGTSGTAHLQNPKRHPHRVHFSNGRSSECPDMASRLRDRSQSSQDPRALASS